MIDNPHDEPADQDRTVFRPSPGGVRRAAAKPEPQPAPRAASRPVGAPTFETVAASGDPLMVAAAPLLHLLSHLRNTITPPDPGDMRERTWRELRTFEQTARQAGVSPLHIRLAHYALCATLDDVVLNLPWGARGRWRDEPLAKALHKDDSAGAGFFDQLRTMRDGLPDTVPVVALMFVCLSLGMMGPYRDSPDGRNQLDRIRHHVFELVARNMPTVPAQLAPDAKGVDAHFQPARAGLPVWVVASVLIAGLAGLYVWLLDGLNNASDAVYRTALASPPTAMPALVRPAATPPPPPPPPPAIPGPAERLRAALADVGGVEVIDGASIIVRVPAKLLFPQPTATIGPGTVPDKLIDALKDVAGPIKVLGYTDAQAEKSVKFPSNLALSKARAIAVCNALAAKLSDPARLSAEGRAEADPVDPKAPERNRRIDIVLAAQP